MRKLVVSLLFVPGLSASLIAHADNALTTEQLLRATQMSVAANQAADPEMAKATSGFRVATVGTSAQVTVDMKAGGMNMSTKYLCVPQGQDMACRAQQ